MNTQIAIAYEKIEYQEGVLIYKPIGMVLGNSTLHNNQKVFKTEENQLFYFANNTAILNEEVHYVVDNVINKEDLINSFEGKMEEEEILDIYLNTFLQRLFFGIYLEEYDVLELGQLDLNMAYENLFYETMANRDPEKYQMLEEEYNKQFEKRTIGFLQENEKINPNAKKPKRTIGFISEEIQENKVLTKKNKIGF